MVIDKARQFTPFRTLGNSITFTTHYAMKIPFRGIPFARKKGVKSSDAVRWNTNRKNDCNNYEELTDDNVALDEAAIADVDSNKLMKNIEKELNKAKFTALGKVKQQRKVTDIDLLHLQSERDVILTDNSDGNTNKMKLQLIEERMANAVV